MRHLLLVLPMLAGCAAVDDKTPHITKFTYKGPAGGAAAVGVDVPPELAGQQVEFTYETSADKTAEFLKEKVNADGSSEYTHLGTGSDSGYVHKSRVSDNEQITKALEIQAAAWVAGGQNVTSFTQGVLAAYGVPTGGGSSPAPPVSDAAEAAELGAILRDLSDRLDRLENEPNREPDLPTPEVPEEEDPEEGG